jgi:hypothetical protein
LPTDHALYENNYPPARVAEVAATRERLLFGVFQLQAQKRLLTGLRRNSSWEIETENQ